MILSASRRTDLPNYWGDWFLRRIHEGYAYVRNPMNARQISRVSLAPEVVDCIVFWTKNPAGLLPRLDELEGYQYYFQFTITGYGVDVEPGIPDKKEVVIPAFQELSRRLGPKRVVWRYDPILFSRRYPAEYHLRAFGDIAARLEGCGERAVISFVDFYARFRRSAAELGVQERTAAELLAFAERLSEIAARRGFTVESCAEEIDLERAGIRHGSCIGKELIEEILGCGLKAGRDKNQRPACGCLESVDIGAYDTCRSGCRYCYATSRRARADAAQCSPDSPLLWGQVGPEDVVTERKVCSWRMEQCKFF